MAESPRASRPSKGEYLAVFLLACALYANTLGHGYVLDDNTVIRDNPQVEAGFGGIPGILASPFAFGANENAGYRPLSVVTFALEHALFGYAPRVGHAINVLLYALTGVLLLRVLGRFLGGHGRLLPLVTTLLYVAHPLHTEVVANLKSRDLLLCLLACLAALECMLRHAEERRPATLLAGAAFFFLALLSRQSALPFVLAIPLTLAFFARTDRRRVLEVTAVLSATALAYLWIYRAVSGSVVPSGYRSSISLVSNALANIPDPLDRLATTAKTWGLYLRLLVLPHPLSYDYSYNQIPTAGWNHPGALASLAAYVAAGLYALLRIRHDPVRSFGILFYLTTFSVVANLLVQTGDVMAVRFMYIPSIGFCLILAYSMTRALRVPADAGIAGSRGLLVALGAVLALYSGLTVARNRDWRSDATLFTADVRVSPNSAKANLGHGIALLNRSAEEGGARRSELIREGIAALERALEIHPLYPDVFAALEVAYRMSGDESAARDALERRIAVHRELAERFHTDGDPRGVEAHERRAAELGAELKERYGTLGEGRVAREGLEALREGRYDEAVRELEEAYRSDESNPEAAYLLGLALEESGDLEEAVRYYADAISRDAGHSRAHNNLGIIYGRWGQVDAAIRSFERAVEADPGHAKAFYNLGIMYSRKENAAKAEEHLRKAIEIDPEYENAYRALIRLKAAPKEGDPGGTADLEGEGG